MVWAELVAGCCRVNAQQSIVFEFEIINNKTAFIANLPNLLLPVCVYNSASFSENNVDESFKYWQKWRDSSMVGG